MSSSEQDRLEAATSTRLARLGTMPVDTSALDAAIGRRIPRNRPALSPAKWLRAVAALLAMAAVIAAALLASSGGAVMASGAQLMQVHEDVVSGRTAVMQVDSIEQANAALQKQWGAAPALPQAPEQQVMACCMKHIKNKRVACVLLKRQDVPVTLTVAKASELCCPKSAMTMRGGIAYHVESTKDLNMVMTQREGRLICLVGALPAEELMEMAGKLTFQE